MFAAVQKWRVWFFQTLIFIRKLSLFIATLGKIQKCLINVCNLVEVIKKLFWWSSWKRKYRICHFSSRSQQVVLKIPPGIKIQSIIAIKTLFEISTQFIYVICPASNKLNKLSKLLTTVTTSRVLRNEKKNPNKAGSPSANTSFLILNQQWQNFYSTACLRRCSLFNVLCIKR